MYGVSEVHISDEYERYGAARDARVEAAGITLVRTGSPYAVTPGRVVKPTDGTPYKVYTPFYKAWCAHGWRAPAKTPAKIPAVKPPAKYRAFPDFVMPEGAQVIAAGEKAARFVRMCDAFGIPLVVIADVSGFLPGAGQEWEGAVRRGAKLLHAFGEAVVPRVTLITRHAYGGAYVAMNSRALGATKVFAWPNADVAVMGSVAAVRVLHRRLLADVSADQRENMELELAAKHEQESGGVQRAIEIGVVDSVIEPNKTRSEIARAIASAPHRRGSHGNIPL